MRYLGIDYGEKRIGLALSDAHGTIASPYRTIINGRGFEKRIKEIVTKEEVSMVIMGLPLPFSGNESVQTASAKRFTAHLAKNIRIPIKFENEIFSTKLAKHSHVPKKHIDKVSAAIILQSYLDKHRYQTTRN